MLSEKPDYSFDLIDYIREYIRNFPNNDFSVFLQQAENDGVTHVYPDNSLKTNFSRCGGKPVGRRNYTRVRRHVNIYDRDLLVRESENILQLNNNVMTFPDLRSKLEEKKCPTEPNFFSHLLKERSDKFTVNPGKGQRPMVIATLGFDPIIPDFKDKIKDEAIQYLLNCKDYSGDRKTIYAKYKSLIPDDLKKEPILSKIFNDKSTFVNDSGKKDSSAVIKLTPAIITEYAQEVPSQPASAKLSKETVETIYKTAPAYDWKSLREILYFQMKSFFAKEATVNIISGLDGMYRVMANGKDSIPIDNSFHLLLSALPDHYNNRLALDREKHLKDDCTACFETYLSNFYFLKKNKDIHEEIAQQDNIPIYNIGLGKIIGQLEYKGFLPSKGCCPKYPRFSIDYEICNALKRIKEGRLNDIGHRSVSQDISKYSIEQRISDVLFVFIYLGLEINLSD